MNGEKNITKLIIILFVMGFIGWGISRFSDGSPNDSYNTNQPIYEITGQQQAVVVEADRIREQLDNFGASLHEADRAVEASQDGAAQISDGINRSKQLLGECRRIAESNEQIFAELRNSAGVGEGASEGPGAKD